MRMTLTHVAAILGLGQPMQATWKAVERFSAGAAIDSREVNLGDLFFCLPGERTDGHDHARQAVDNGAAAVVATRFLPELAERVPVLVVRDAVVALGALASVWRRQFAGRVVGVTGSAGKTTVKEMLAQVCSQAGTTCWNRLNLNNQIGLPLSLLSCSGQEDFWVMEAGISRPSDMDELGVILRPDLAVLLNAGPAHLVELGCVARVAAAKARLVAHLRPDGLALVNQDCPDLWRESSGYTHRVHGFSLLDPAAEFYSSGQSPADQGNEQEQGHVRMELVLHGRSMELTWPAEKAPLAQNVLAVAGAATLLGIDHDALRNGLTTEISLPGRFAVEKHGPWVLVDDTYNANPLSMHQALRRAVDLAGKRKLSCVLGDMLELGAAAAVEHEKLGQALARLGCSRVYYHGHHAADVRLGWKASGERGRFMECETPDDFVSGWRKGAKDGGVVLFKGSRAGKMETYLEALRTELSA